MKRKLDWQHLMCIYIQANLHRNFLHFEQSHDRDVKVILLGPQFLRHWRGMCNEENATSAILFVLLSSVSIYFVF